MNKIFAVTVLTVQVIASSHAIAQAPVFDIKNFQQSLQQVAAWKKQYDQMLQQHQQLLAQHQSLTGTRNLGMIADAPQLRAFIPDDVAQTYDNIRAAGSGSLTGAALKIRNSSQIYNCADRKGDNKSTCEAFLNMTAQTQAFQQQAMALLSQRRKQIQYLQGQINTTNDPKSISELQARLQVEAAQVNNDTNRLALLNAMASSAERSTQQALKERELRNLSLTSDGTDTFVYKPFTGR